MVCMLLFKLSEPCLCFIQFLSLLILKLLYQELLTKFLLYLFKSLFAYQYFCSNILFYCVKKEPSVTSLDGIAVEVIELHL